MSAPVIPFITRNHREHAKAEARRQILSSTVPLGNKMQLLALVNPAALGDIETLVDAYLLAAPDGRKGA